MRVVAALLVLGLARPGCGDDEAARAPVAPPPFVGVPWVLSSGLDVEGWEEAAPSAVFADEMVGGDRLQPLQGAVHRRRRALTLGAIASTQMACPPPADEVERTHRRAATGRVADGRRPARSARRRRRRASPLPRGDPLGEWEVTAFFGDAASRAHCRDVDHRDVRRGRQAHRLRRPQHGTRRRSPKPGSDRDRGAGLDQEALLRARGRDGAGGGVPAVLPSAVEYRVDGGSLSLLSADGTYVATLERPAVARPTRRRSSRRVSSADGSAGDRARRGGARAIPDERRRSRLGRVPGAGARVAGPVRHLRRPRSTAARTPSGDAEVEFPIERLEAVRLRARVRRSGPRTFAGEARRQQHGPAVQRAGGDRAERRRPDESDGQPRRDRGDELAPGATADEQWAFVRDGLSRFAGRPLGLDEEVYESASATNAQNRRLAPASAA